MDKDEERGLQEPLLAELQRAEQHVNAEEVIEELPAQHPRSSVAVSTLNLCCTILGAGMFALPRAFGGLGLLGGLAMVGGVAYMTYLSVVVMLRASERSGRDTYASTIGALWGSGAAAAVRASIILACAGFLILYLIVLVDVCIGGKDYNGFIYDLWPQLPDPPPWYLSRSAMLTWFALVVAPLLPARTVGGLARVSAFKVATSLCCTAILAALAVGAARKGKLHYRLFPDPKWFGQGTVCILTQALGTVPVVMTALIMQYNVHPIMQDLENYSKSRMRRVVAFSLGACSVVYAVAGGCGYAVFGRDVKGNVLASLTPETVGELLGGPTVGLALVVGIKVGVALVMLTGFPMVMFPLRADLIDTVLAFTGGKVMSTTGYLTVTYCTLGLVYGSALLVESAYEMTSLIGAICGIATGFIFPGLLAWRNEHGWAWRLFAAMLLVVGTALMAAGVAAPFLDGSGGDPGAASMQLLWPLLGGH